MPSDAAGATTEAVRLKRRLRDARGDLKAARAEIARLRSALEAAGFSGDGEPPMTAAEIRHMYALFVPSEPGTRCPECGQGHTGPCQTCGGSHPFRACPRVRSVEYQTQGDRVIIRRVEYWRTWDASGITFADELPPIPGEA